MKMTPPSFTRRLLALALAICPLERGFSQIVSFDFNDPTNGVTTANGGSSGGSALLTNGSGASTDLHGGPGSGVSGIHGDFALDNSASAMGGSGGRGAIAVGTALNSLSSFTIAGWFRADSMVGGAARLVEFSGGQTTVRLDAGAPGRLSLTLQTPTLSSSTVYSSNTSDAYQGVDVWTFFAVTYDGTQSSNNIKFYTGGLGDGVSQVGTSLTLNGGSIGTVAGDLLLGNNINFGRAFEGLLDQIAIYGVTSGSGGALSFQELEDIRVAALIPEPSAFAFLIATVGGGLLLRHRKRIILKA